MSNPCTTVSAGDTGKAVTLNYYGIDSLADDRGWVTLTTVLIRLDTHYTPSGHFPVYSNTSRTDSPVGYDAVVCVQRYESWIVETYNTSIASPSILRIVGKGNGSTPLLPSGDIRGAPISNTRYLTTTEKFLAFSDTDVEALWRLDRDLNLGDFYDFPEAVGPAVSTRITSFLTSTHSVDRFSHRGCGVLGVH